MKTLIKIFIFIITFAFFNQSLLSTQDNKSLIYAHKNIELIQNILSKKDSSERREFLKTIIQSSILNPVFYKEENKLNLKKTSSFNKNFDDFFLEKSIEFFVKTHLILKDQNYGSIKNTSEYFYIYLSFAIVSSHFQTISSIIQIHPSKEVFLKTKKRDDIIEIIMTCYIIKIFETTVSLLIDLMINSEEIDQEMIFKIEDIFNSKKPVKTEGKFTEKTSKPLKENVLHSILNQELMTTSYIRNSRKKISLKNEMEHFIDIQKIFYNQDHFISYLTHIEDENIFHLLEKHQYHNNIYEYLEEFSNPKKDLELKNEEMQQKIKVDLRLLAFHHPYDYYNHKRVLRWQNAINKTTDERVAYVSKFKDNKNGRLVQLYSLENNPEITDEEFEDFINEQTTYHGFLSIYNLKILSEKNEKLKKYYLSKPVKGKKQIKYVFRVSLKIGEKDKKHGLIHLSTDIKKNGKEIVYHNCFEPYQESNYSILEIFKKRFSQKHAYEIFIPKKFKTNRLVFFDGEVNETDGVIHLTSNKKDFPVQYWVYPYFK